MSAGVNDTRTGRTQVLPFASTIDLATSWLGCAFGRSPFALVGLPLIVLVLATFLLTITEADLALSQAFYDKHGACWPMRDMQPWQLLYDFGCLPGLSLGVSGLGLATVALLRKRRQHDWRPGLFLALMLLLGPGLLVNLCMKDHWGRPRPHEISDFGGQRDYHPVWCPSAENGYSFPSGHASMGFYLMAPGFLLWRTRRVAAVTFFGLGLIAGTAMGMARIIQGSHFATDILWSAGFVYFAGILLSPLLETRPSRHRGPSISPEDEFSLRVPPDRMSEAATDSGSESQKLPKAA